MQSAADFSLEIMEWNDIFKGLKEKTANQEFFM